MASKIELVPMASFVTRYANSTDIKPMAARIAKMMVIMFGLFSAIKTRKQCWFKHSPITNSSSYSVCGLVKKFFCWWHEFPLPSYFNAATINAGRGQSITTGLVFVKSLFLFPITTRYTMFKSHRVLYKIFVIRNTQSFCCAFYSAIVRLCHSQSFQRLNIPII